MMQSFIIKPVLGLKTDVPPDDPSLFKPLGDGYALTHCVDAQNIRVTEKRGSTTKAAGRIQWSNSATTDTQNCLGMFELYDGTNRTHWVFMGDNTSKGRIFRYDSGRDPVRISDVVGHSGATEWAYNDLDKYSIIRFKNYIVFSDNAEHTPYCADHDDTTVAKLVNSGTEYKGKYLESYQNRIIMANIDTSQITNGDISIIWTDALPTPGSNCTFGTGDPPSNHLFKRNDDPITGIKRFGNNACFLYGRNSIDSIDYYPNFTTPFAIRNMVPDQGAANNDSIISVGHRHFLFNENYGFCEYRGGAEFPFGGAPISEPIESLVSTIARSYYGHIIGKYLPTLNMLAWTVPLYGSTTPTHVLYYHLIDQAWTIDNRAVWYLDNWITATDVTWQDLIDQGYDQWADFGSKRLADFVSENPYIVLSDTDGHVYSLEGSSDKGSAFNGYRTEPVMSLGNPGDKKVLFELWFNLTSHGNFNLYCQYRAGDTVREVENENWSDLPELSCDNPAEPVIRIPDSLCKAQRLHQIRYGTDGSGEQFGVNEIEFKFVSHGRY